MYDTSTAIRKEPFDPQEVESLFCRKYGIVPGELEASIFSKLPAIIRIIFLILWALEIAVNELGQTPNQRVIRNLLLTTMTASENEALDEGYGINFPYRRKIKA